MKTAREKAEEWLVACVAWSTPGQANELEKLLKEQDAESRKLQDRDTRHACAYNIGKFTNRKQLPVCGICKMQLDRIIMNTKAV